MSSPELMQTYFPVSLLSNSCYSEPSFYFCLAFSFFFFFFAKRTEAHKGNYYPWALPPAYKGGYSKMAITISLRNASVLTAPVNLMFRVDARGINSPVPGGCCTTCMISNNDPSLGIR